MSAFSVLSGSVPGASPLPCSPLSLAQRRAPPHLHGRKKWGSTGSGRISMASPISPQLSKNNGARLSGGAWVPETAAFWSQKIWFPCASEWKKAADLQPKERHPTVSLTELEKTHQPFLLLGQKWSWTWPVTTVERVIIQIPHVMVVYQYSKQRSSLVRKAIYLYAEISRSVV